MTKSVFVTTPAYGGQVTVEYAYSQFLSTVWFLKNKIRCGWFFLPDDSLVNRARNRCVSAFMSTGLSHMLFIDADMGWTEDDLASLLAPDVPVVAGTYPVKRPPVNLNFNPLPKDDEFFPDALRTVERFHAWQDARADERGLIEVLHAPTGFMLIERSVFEKLQRWAAPYYYPDGSVEYDYFPVEVEEGQLLSEDWGFCNLCQEEQIPIYLDTDVVTAHQGIHTFRAE